MEQLAQAQDQLYTVDEAETMRALAGVREDLFAAWSWCVEQGRDRPPDGKPVVRPL
ncbi:MAG: hypothetical protein R2838_15960 [Caldilineaceae bacterium]